MTQRNRYPLDFKRAVVRELKQSNKLVKQVAAKYNLNPNTLCQWRKRIRVRGERPSALQPAAATQAPSRPSAEGERTALAKAQAEIGLLQARLQVWQEAYQQLLQQTRKRAPGVPPAP